MKSICDHINHNAQMKIDDSAYEHEILKSAAAKFILNEIFSEKGETKS
jgi:hypothetical protein